MLSRRARPAPPAPSWRRLRADLEGRVDLLDLGVTDPRHVARTASDAWVAAALAEAARAPHDEDGAKRAVADFLGRRGVAVEPAQVNLTATRPLAMQAVLQIVADPGEVVLAHPGLGLDGPAEAAQVTIESRTAFGEGPVSQQTDGRAFVLANPSRIEGRCPTALERRALVRSVEGRCRMLIVDESDLHLLDAPERYARVSFASESEAPVAVLGDLGSATGRPDLALAWCVISGPPEAVAVTSGALEPRLAALGPPAGLLLAALPRLLEGAEDTAPAVQDRLRENLEHLVTEARAHGLAIRPRDGGPTVALELPPAVEVESFAEELLTGDHVVVAVAEGKVVLGLLTAPEDFAVGLGALISRLDGSGSGP